MGGADVYCALCGGPLSTPWWETEPEGEDDLKYIYDPAILPHDSVKLDWLSDVRIIGDNPASTGLNRVWVSGPAAHDDHGYFDLDIEEPENAAVVEGLGGEMLKTYAYRGHPAFAVPYHRPCWKLFSKYLNVETDEINKEIIFQVLRQLAHTSEYAQTLNLDYGSVSEPQEQYWWVRRGEEHFVHSPLDIPQLAEYYLELPKLGLDLPMKDAPLGNHSAASDPISKLPTEIRWSILACADVTSIMKLFQASRALYDTKPPSSWWRLKLLADMPWLFEFSAVENPEKIDWARVYKDLWLGSRYKPSAHRIPGLANRRRIWEEILPQLADPYQKLKRELDLVEQPDILKGARSTGLRRLITPEPKANFSSTFYFAKSIEGLRYAHIEFLVHLDQEQIVRGLCFAGSEQNSGESSTTQSSTFHFPTSVEVVSVPDDDCLTGITVISREFQDDGDAVRKIVGLEFMLGSSPPHKIGSSDGDKRLIHVSESYIAVGIEIFSSQEGGLSRISLIEQHSVLARGIDRFISRHPNANNMTMNAIKCLWRDQLPPPAMQLTDYDTGYWTYDMEKDLSPMEALVFGTTEEELADITAISADVLFGGFEVHYGSRPSRSIGPRNFAMKTLSIDGRGGERMVALHSVVDYLPQGLRIATNLGRQLIVGRPGWNEMQEVRHPPYDPFEDQLACLGGIYGWWSTRSTPRFRLEAVGCLVSTELGCEGQVMAMPAPTRGFQDTQWEPSALPSSLQETGPILGKFTLFKAPNGGFRQLKNCRIHSWLDCSRPLSEVRVIQCHSIKDNQAPLCAIAFKYADGANEDVAIGPELSPQPPSDTEGENGNYWCWCSFSGAKAEEELNERPHYQRSVWKLDGKRLQSVRAFLSPINGEMGNGKRLVGIKFIAEDGSESPEWSHWGRGPDVDYSVEDIAFTDDRVGLKFFIGQSRRSVTYEDTIICALQALEKST